nr:vacuolar protein sorting-associated protein 24 homolog 1-like isoform X1 [Physcomitrium patens]|eukprot:XP_024396394.1 vacuolar protein sorting-associated protein 24 homolog 1-like isoform X1 [Physcomitrella patens]
MSIALNSILYPCTWEKVWAGVMEEILNEGLDSALDNEDMEEEIEEEVDKLLSELAVETAVQLPSAGASREKPANERLKPLSQSAKKQQEVAAAAEGGDDDEELDYVVDWRVCDHDEINYIPFKHSTTSKYLASKDLTAEEEE